MLINIHRQKLKWKHAIETSKEETLCKGWCICEPLEMIDLGRVVVKSEEEKLWLVSKGLNTPQGFTTS